MPGRLASAWQCDLYSASGHCLLTLRARSALEGLQQLVTKLAALRWNGERVALRRVR